MKQDVTPMRSVDVVGARSTRQKAAIRKAFDGANRPLSASEVLEISSSDVSGIGIATVYRNIKFMLEAGVLATVELPGQAPRYERNGLQRHHYFHCTSCDKVYSVGLCEVSTKKVLPRGFKLAGHTTILYGTCSACGNGSR